MARKFTTVSGLGRCVVLLRGKHRLQPCRVRIVQSESRNGIYAVIDKPAPGEIVPITSMDPGHLLRSFSAFEWEFAIDLDAGDDH